MGITIQQITGGGSAQAATTFQYLLSGSSATYTTPANCTGILVRAIGGGGGGGGGGYVGSSTGFSGAGGDAGEYFELYIASPSATYTYTIGAKGTAGNAGTSGDGGGAGGSGLIIVAEFYG